MHHRFAATFLALALACVAAAPLMAESGTSTLAGKLIGTDGRPIAGAVLVAYHLSSESVFRSAPSGNDGEYRINDIPYGYFDLAIETAAGLYVADQVVNVPPAGKAVLSLEISTGAGETRAFPGADGTPVGVASVSRRTTGRDFWRSPKGVAIIAGGAGAGLLAVASGGGSDDPVASPSGL